MKVGTDGTLLGAWASGGSRILDVGTGTGLIALMMAQRFPGAYVTGIDVVPEAVLQARSNVAESPFSQRVDIVLGDVRTWGDEFMPSYDAIVSNPPYFDLSLESPDALRATARHSSSLSYRELIAAAWRLLSDEGELSLIIPSECREKLETEAILAGFFKVRQCAVRTTPRKPVRRYLLAFRKHSSAEGLQLSEGIIEELPGQRSAWYSVLTKDFYL